MFPSVEDFQVMKCCQIGKRFPGGKLFPVGNHFQYFPVGNVSRLGSVSLFRKDSLLESVIFRNEKSSPDFPSWVRMVGGYLITQKID